MNLQQLRYLVAVSDCGSVTAAARSLGVSQPVISRAIHAFEAEHGVTVFGLVGRRLAITDAAEPIVQAARQALAAVDAVGQTAETMRDDHELVLATTPTNGLLLTAALSELHRCEPRLAIRVCRADDADDVLRMVADGAVEVGFSELTPLARDRRLTVLPVVDLEVVFVSPVGTDLPSTVSWDDVVAQPLIVPPTDSGRRALINEMAMAATGTLPEATVVFEDRGSWLAAAQGGMGSFLSYRSLVADQPHIEIRPFTPPQAVTVGFVHQDCEISAGATRLIQLARQTTVAAADD
jgi:LysR family transcriptional regulator, nitrogen assimilation regulatory protein